MPYDPENPPAKLRGLSSAKQRQWVHVFNSCYEKYSDDAKCSKMAWGETGGWKDEKGYEFERDPSVEREALVRMEVDEALDVIVKGLGGET